jgi:hypothetical protein
MPKIASKEVYNLLTVDKPLFDTITDYSISKTYIAEKLFGDEWDSNDIELKKKLTVRLHNKLSGSGKLTDKEHERIQDIVGEYADGIKTRVADSIRRRKQRLQDVTEFTRKLVSTGMIQHDAISELEDEILRVLSNVKKKYDKPEPKEATPTDTESHQADPTTQTEPTSFTPEFGNQLHA